MRSEIQENLSFTPKETDIYRIHQSGDLANLDGLDDSSLKRLPSLLSLRDALYSEAFRTYLSQLTQAGPLSGKKTDMAVNVYTPGCHLLCHDDVIGSRRVSYILYLTDPDDPWREEWGGALRLYPTQTFAGKHDRFVKVPSPDYSVSIPPSFSQLSFFAVQPGESFHDVEEVYAHEKGSEGEGNDKRVRMAISGWYHVPQEGEHGYRPGLEEELAEQSSLQQLQGKADQYDLPQPAFTLYDTTVNEEKNEKPDENASLGESSEDQLLSEEDLEFLLKFLAPTYLTPDTLESVSDAFTDQCSLCLDNVLSRKFADQLQDFIVAEESKPLPAATAELEDKTVWKVARPPHKHRFLFQHPSKVYVGDPSLQSPFYSLLNDLLPSKPFRKWLQLATGQDIRSHNLLARRFRHGKDYTLATGYDEESPRLEVTLSITPTSGWDDIDTAEAQETNAAETTTPEATASETEAQENDAPETTVPETTAPETTAPETTAPETAAPGTATPEAVAPETTSGEPAIDHSPAVGGYLAYMAGDEDADNNEAGSDHGIAVPTDMSTGGRASSVMKPKRSKADPAVYQAAADDNDDGVLFSMPASWNRMGLVLRDRGTMRFVKYVSQQAKGDRWDILGEFEIDDHDDCGEENEENDAREKEAQEAHHAGRNNRTVGLLGDSSEEETERFESDDSDDSDD